MIGDDPIKGERYGPAIQRSGPKAEISDLKLFVRGCIFSSSVAAEEASVCLIATTWPRKVIYMASCIIETVQFLTWAKDSPGRRKQCTHRGPSYGTKPCSPRRFFKRTPAVGRFFSLDAGPNRVTAGPIW